MDSLTEIIRRVLHIERRIDRLESLETPTIGGGGGVPGAPNDAQYVTLALDAGLTAERVLTEGPDIDLVDGGANTTITVGRGGDTILLFDSGGNPVAEFAFTNAGLTAAHAAAGAGDVIQLPAGTIASVALAITKSVKIVGSGQGITILQGTDAAPVIDVQGCSPVLSDLTATQAGATGVTKCLWIHASANVTANNCSFIGHANNSNGIDVSDSGALNPNNVVAQGYNGIYLWPVPAAGTSFLSEISCYAEHNGADAASINCQGGRAILHSVHLIANFAAAYHILQVNPGIVNVFLMRATNDIYVPVDFRILGSIVYDLGDRSSWDVTTYFARHASDINASAPTYHNSLGNAIGDIQYWDGSKWVLLADVAAGQPLLSGGVATDPAYAGWTLAGTAGQTYTLGYRKVTTYTDTCNILVTDDVVVFNKATAFTATMPAAVVGQDFYFKNIGAGNVTLSFPGADTVDEVDSDLILTQYDAHHLVCRAANAWVKL